MNRIIMAVLLVWIFGAAMGLITHYAIEAQPTKRVAAEWMGYEMFKRNAR